MLSLFVLLALPLCIFSVALPPGGKATVQKNLRSDVRWEDLAKQRYPQTFDEAKRYLSEVEQGDNPYNIVITEEQNFTRISFKSLLYKDRPMVMPNRYILANKLPPICTGKRDLPYALFLPGYAAIPEDYSIGFPFMTDLIKNGTMCCFYTFMPFFFMLPAGGYWYTNNAVTIPETFIFVEILSVISRAMGDNVTKDPERRILAGHSMGGYGAVMNAMRTNMQFFGSVCGLNGGLYIWSLKEFQDEVARDVLNEAITRKNGPFQGCSYNQPPYRYYADDINFNTMIATSLATVFQSDGTIVPKLNSPYFSATLFEPDCTRYQQMFGFRFWLRPDGSLDSQLFDIAPWNSPIGFLERNYPALQEEMSGHLFLSTTYNDTLVDFTENIRFSAELTRYNVSHVLYIYNGTHYDVLEGVEKCLTTFAPKICSGSSQLPADKLEDANPILFGGFITASLAAVLLVMMALGIAYIK